MCDSCNLCDFIQRESKCFILSHIYILRNKCDLSNLCDFSKKYQLFKKLGTVTCVIYVTCVISIKVSQNGIVLIIKPTSVIGVTYVISKKKSSLKIKDRNMCDLSNLCDFIIREFKWSHIDILRNKCDLSNICNFSKTSSRTFQLAYGAICVTCVINKI